MVELSIKYLSSCARTEKYNSVEEAYDRVVDLFETCKCFYNSTQGLQNKKELKLQPVPSISGDTVIQVLMPPDMRVDTRYHSNDRLLVVFRISEEIQNGEKV
jgi:hypothetical protein